MLLLSVVDSVEGEGEIVQAGPNEASERLLSKKKVASHVHSYQQHPARFGVQTFSFSRPVLLCERQTDTTDCVLTKGIRTKMCFANDISMRFFLLTNKYCFAHHVVDFVNHQFFGKKRRKKMVLIAPYFFYMPQSKFHFCGM